MPFAPKERRALWKLFKIVAWSAVSLGVAFVVVGGAIIAHWVF